MKIVSVDAVPVSVPRRKILGRTYESGTGVIPRSEFTVVRVRTDEGIEGIGEASSVFLRRGALLAYEIRNYLAPAVIGGDPLSLTALCRRMDERIDGATISKAAVEMALYDIAGKALGVPVYALLGGKVREGVPLSYSMPFGRPEDTAEFARQLVGEGFRTLKMKVGRDSKRDIETVRLVRETVGPGVTLRVDANMCWPTAKDAIRHINAMEPYGIELIEQPLAARDLSGMAEVRRHVRVPIMADESVWTHEDAADVIRAGAADILNVYVTESGGISRATLLCRMAAAFHVPCMLGAMPELGIGTAANIHVAIANDNLPFGNDACGSLYHDGDVIQPGLTFRDGMAFAPDGPGLGVTLDERELKRFMVEA